MKSATQLAFYGAITIIISRIFYVISSLGIFGAMNEFLNNIHIVFSTLDLLAWLSFLNFFYTLLQKQNQKSKQDE
jgi:hypothetical protein